MWQLALWIIRWLKTPQRSSRSLVLLYSKIIKPLAKIWWRWFIIKPYNISLRWQRWFKNLEDGFNITYLLRHHAVVLYLIILIGALVSWQNLATQTQAAESFGQGNLLYPLITSSYDTPLNQLNEPGALNENGVDDTNGATVDNSQTNVNTAGEPMIILTEDGAAFLKPYLVTTQPGVAGRERIEYYAVKSGDTISSIAQNYGLNVNTLLWENRLSLRSVLRIGQRLTILPTNGLSYRVGRGETVSKIAKKFGVNADSINEFNNLGGKLTVGQTLVIPGAKPIYTPPAVTSRVNTIIPESKFTLGPSAPLSSSRMQWPTVNRRITQYFSWRHPGLDIADKIGTPVYAAEDGIVEVAGWNRGGYGLYIIIDHGGGIKTLYSHNSKLLATVGDRVARGQQIAAMGSTGRSTGSHVHFEVRVYNRRTNPLNYTR